MTRKSILAVMALITVLALASLACGIRVPVKYVKTGPTQTEDIDIPVPDSSGAAELSLAFGVGNLLIEPGAEGALVSGKATYNVEDLRPIIETSDGADVTLRQGTDPNGGFSTIEGDIKNEWDIQLGDTPIKLNIKAGAYEGRYELGGLALEKLTIQDGAANVKVLFSKPNTVKMSLLRYETGASNVTLKGLANANFSEMEFRSGAGDYTLDFTGELQQDAEVTVESGISSVTIVVPEGMNVDLTFEGGLSNVSTSGEWQQKGSRYIQTGAGLTLTITVKMGAGSLNLENP
jgi:hypothetical protein